MVQREHGSALAYLSKHKHRRATISEDIPHDYRRRIVLPCQRGLEKLRLSREIAVVQHSTETEAVKEIESQLAKSPRRGAKTEAGAEADGEADEADADGDDTAVADEAA